MEKPKTEEEVVAEENYGRGTIGPVATFLAKIRLSVDSLSLRVAMGPTFPPSTESDEGTPAVEPLQKTGEVA